MFFSYLKLISFRSLEFELWADNVRLLKGQDIYSAIASYFELVYVFQLHYPKECQTVSNILQEYVAKYGSVESGVNLTKSKTSTVVNKLEKYSRIVMALQ